MSTPIEPGTASSEPGDDPASATPTAQNRPGRRRSAVTDVGTDPDPRFTLANERTFLAWNRTALALMGGGLAVAQFLKVGIGGGRLILALPLIALGAATSLSSYLRWEHNERALRLNQPLPTSPLPRILAYGVAILAVAAIGLAVAQYASR